MFCPIFARDLYKNLHVAREHCILWNSNTTPFYFGVLFTTPFTLSFSHDAVFTTYNFFFVFFFFSVNHMQFILSGP